MARDPAQRRSELVRRVLLELIDAHDAAPDLHPAWVDDRTAVLLVEAAEAHGLASTLHDHLVEQHLEPTPELVESRHGATARRLAAKTSLLRIGAAYDAADLPWLTCKGAVVAARHERPEHREFNDLDLLVPGSRLTEAIAIAEAAGITSVNRNWTAFVEHGVGELPLVDGSVWIDLHWDLVGIERVRRGFRVDPEAMLARRRRLPFHGEQVPVLDEIDEVLHLALHAGLGGGGRLAWLRDLRVVVAANRPDWDELVMRARDARIAVISGQVLDRARDLARADVPDGVAESLVPRPLLVARRRLDRRPPSAAVLARRIGTGTVVRCGRDGAAATVVAVGHEVEAKLRSAVGRPVRWDVADPAGILYWAMSAGDDADRERYLQMAATA